QLNKLLVGFPFVDDAAKAVALSSILTALCRRTLRSAPVHGFDAPTPGTGKTLLANIPNQILTGRKSTAVSQGGDEAEDEKRLLGILMRGDPVVLIDNLKRPIAGDALCTVLTEPPWQCRLLGANTQVHVPTNVLFEASGNNLEIAGDMTRRALVCRLDARMEQ